MSSQPIPAGPDLEAMIGLIRERYRHAVVARIEGAVFFSLDEKHWPNFATIVWTDDFDMGNPSDLARPGSYRVNIGLDKDSFQRVVGSIGEPDYAAFDQLLPHPVYAKQRWVAILNPSDVTVRDVVLPLLAAAHDRLAALRAQQHRGDRRC